MSLQSNARSAAFNALQGVFREVSCPEFAVGGKIRLPMPDLVIDGVGEISMPLLQVQADAIKAVGGKAPYGKGSETIIDSSVRDSTVTHDTSKGILHLERWTRMGIFVCTSTY